jgi:hypothetical protein
MLTFLVPVLFTIYIQDVLILKKNSGAKGLMTHEKRCLTVPREPSSDHAITNAAAYTALELS